MMNVKECYEMFGGNYEEIMRLLMTEARVIKYLLKFRKDTCMQELTNALSHNETDVEDLYNNVKEDYDLIIEAIRCLEEE